MTRSKGHNRVFHSIAAALIIGVGVLILTYAMNAKDVANRDYISYWAAAQQLVHHGNPYDGPAILGLERRAGLSDSRAFFMRNHPIAFFMTLPLMLVSAKAGAVLWSLAIIAALMGSIRMIWKLHGQPDDSLHLVAYLFPPALACLLAGQIGIFLLLGIVLFLFLQEHHPYAAGASLLLCAAKPHLLIPFWVVLIVWSVSRRSYKILLGAAAAIATSLLLAYVLDPRGWSHYEQMLNTAQIQNEFIPTISLMFRLAIHRNFLWLQIIPAAIGTGWAIWFFSTRQEQWKWNEHGMLVLLVSIMVSPYAWFSDEVIVLPAILASLYLASNMGRSLLPFGIIAGIALIEVLAGLPMNSWAYLWTPSAWLIWYVWASRSPNLILNHDGLAISSSR